MMSHQELVKAIKTARYVYAWTNLTEHEGGYIQVVKKNALLAVQNFPEGTDEEPMPEFNASFREHNDLYIN